MPPAKHEYLREVIHAEYVAFITNIKILEFTVPT